MTTPRRRSRSHVDNPVFGDERAQRAWMEAYVVAYEVALLAALSLATVMVWVGGRPLLWWSVAVVWVVGLGNLAALAHLRSAGLSDLPWRDRLRFWSFRLRLVLIAAYAVGLLRAFSSDVQLPEGGLDAATLAGMLVGASCAIGAFALLDWRTRRRAAAQLPEDDSFVE